MSRLPNTTLSVLASLALAGGPVISAAHAKSVERQAQKDAEARKRTQHHEEGRKTQGSPSHGTDAPSSDKPNAARSGFVAPSAAKPTDTDSSNLNFCLTADLSDVPNAMLVRIGDAPRPVSLTPSLHYPSYQALAPPVPAQVMG